jgi:hypothetical protein
MFESIQFFALVLFHTKNSLLALPTKQGKDIVLIFIIECSSLRDFGPQVVGLFLYKDFLKHDILACVETQDQL